MSDALIEVTSALGINYTVNDEAKKALEASRAKFFKTATEKLAQKALATRVVEVPESQPDIAAYVERYYPGWTLHAVADTKVTIIEDPALKKFTFANPDDGQFYQRLTQQGAPSLDDERLMEEDPDMYHRVTRPMGYTTLKGWLEQYGSAEQFEFFQEYCSEAQNRELKPLEELDHEELAAIQKYMMPGRITTKLAKPREATEDEFEQEESA